MLFQLIWEPVLFWITMLHIMEDTKPTKTSLRPTKVAVAPPTVHKVTSSFKRRKASDHQYVQRIRKFINQLLKCTNLPIILPVAAAMELVVCKTLDFSSRDNPTPLITMLRLLISIMLIWCQACKNSNMRKDWLVWWIIYNPKDNSELKFNNKTWKELTILE